MLKKIILIILVGVFMIGGPILGYAQQLDSETEMVSGVVKEITGTFVRIIESEQDTDEGIVFLINKETALENIDSLNEISINDELFIDFVENNDGALAVNIYKMESYDEEMMIEEYEDENIIFEEIYDDTQEQE